MNSTLRLGQSGYCCGWWNEFDPAVWGGRVVAVAGRMNSTLRLGQSGYCCGWSNEFDPAARAVGLLLWLVE